jgi:hypothetical protein
MLIQRCENPRCKDYPAYGGKGIKVCARWTWQGGFPAFLADVGPQPHPGAGLRRLDESGDFEPGNVVWGETRGHLLTHNGRTQSIAVWARELGIKPGTLRARLHKGWSVEEILGRRVSPRRDYRTWKRRALGKQGSREVT